jgi:hypothetical protein
MELVMERNYVASGVLQQQELGIVQNSVMLVNQKIGCKGREIIPKSYCIHVHMAHKCLSVCLSL